MKWLLIFAVAFVLGCTATVIDGPERAECTEATDCDDGDPCTVNRCRDGSCDNSRYGGECSP